MFMAGEEDKNGIFYSEYYTLKYNESGVEKSHRYRFYGSSFRGEKADFQPKDARKPSEYNLLMFMIEDCEYSETLVREAVNSYAATVIRKFTLFLLILTICLITIIIVYSLSLLKV